MRIIERTIDVYINGGREVLFADTQRSPEQRGSKPVLKAKRLLETACQTLDERLQTHLWLGGDQFSLADCTAAPTLAYLRWVYDYSHFSNLTRYVQRLEARPSVSRTFSEGQAQMLQMRSELHYPLNGQCYLQSNA
jgi:glutathione S-transferase